MPNHLHQRISRLRECVGQGLHQDNLDKLVRECNALAQDSPHVLVFFTLKTVFKEMSDALDGEAVDVGRFQELSGQVADKTRSLLQKLATGTAPDADELEDLVRTHVVNLNLFR